MHFANPEQPISESEIEQCEAACGIRFPRVLRSCYLSSNGGEPEPYVYQNDDLDTVVSEFLPLLSKSRGSAVQSYQRLVSERGIVPQHFFPFAVDGGGDYFFVDTSTPDGRVSFFRSDAADGNQLLPLGLGLEEFWAALKPE
jgi:cell wall assembly regulator SMI1